jgi:hypothetical protein
LDHATGEPASAVSRPEWNTARDYGDLYEYMAKFGGVVEGNIGVMLESRAGRGHDSSRIRGDLEQMSS